jgi:acyl-CoA thioester hydrolase
MQTFEKLITVSEGDLDDLNHVNNIRYIEWVNAIAKAHWEQNASTEMIESYIWVLVKHTIEYKSAAFLGDIIRLRTYVLRSEGVTSTRVVEIHNSKTQDLLVRSETVWCLLNSKTLRPSRITAEMTNLFD